MRKLSPTRIRRKAVRELFLREGCSPTEIADQLLARGMIESKSRQSAIRLVQADVAAIRAETDRTRTADARPEVASNEIDILERRLAELRKQKAHQQMIADGEPDADGHEATLDSTTVVNGKVITSSVPKWHSGDRQRAGMSAAKLAEKIGDLEMILCEKRHVETEFGTDVAEGGLTINESGLTIEELIEQNLTGVK